MHLFTRSENSELGRGIERMEAEVKKDGGAQVIDFQLNFFLFAYFHIFCCP